MLFGLLAIHSSWKKHVLSGVALGLGFLAKEMALYYAAAIVCCGCCRRARSPVQSIRYRGRDPHADGGSVRMVVPLLQHSIQYVIAFAVDSSTEWTDVEYWVNPWYYIFEKLPVDLGVMASSSAWRVLVLGFDFRRRFCPQAVGGRTLDDVMPVWFLAILLTGVHPVQRRPRQGGLVYQPALPVARSASRARPCMPFCAGWRMECDGSRQSARVLRPRGPA